MFTDSETGFSTSDIREVEGEIVRFNRANNSLIWAADGRRFPGYLVDGNFLGCRRRVRRARSRYSTPQCRTVGFRFPVSGAWCESRSELYLGAR